MKTQRENRASATLHFRLQPTLRAQLEKIAEEEKRSLSQVATMTMTLGIGVLKKKRS